jgi:7,8-dihydropterin-6-yl-methyl-4-(beta-D-ribofuranosyl)aminobenzene 5'-phosphate synthase
MAGSGIRKVYAVVGGFHLAPHNEDYLRQTMKELVDASAKRELQAWR